MKKLQQITRQLIVKSFKDGKLLESQVTKSIKFFKALPTEQAALALNEYLKGIKREQRAHTMEIETAIPLPAETLQQIKKVVSKKAVITKVMTAVNPEILGGFRLKVGDEVWDETVLGKVNQIRKEITGGSNRTN